MPYGGGIAEVIGITFRTSRREKRRIKLTYVPLKINIWRLEECKEIQKEVLESKTTDTKG